MGVQGEVNDMRPELKVVRPLHPDGHLYGIGFGSEIISSIGMGHVATRSGEEFTKADWVSITTAAVQGVSQMEAAIAATPMATTYNRAKLVALGGGVPNFSTQVQARLAAFHGAPLGSAWITG